MKRSAALFAAPNQQEFICGWVYLMFQLFALGPCLVWLNGQLTRPLSDPELNFLFFAVNFLAVLLIFHSYLSRSLRQLLRHPVDFLQAVILGYVAYWACGKCLELVFSRIAPQFSNLNDGSVAALGRSNYLLTVIGTVILVPVAEECFYRGLVFRPLYSRSPWAAYAVSMALFSAIHVLGYLGSYSPLHLVLSFCQYLPAGLCLAWSYVKGGTIFAPIAVHALVNARGISLI